MSTWTCSSTGSSWRRSEDLSGTQESDEDYFQRHAAALEALLKEKDVVDAEEMERARKALAAESDAVGVQAVVRAWTDPAFRDRLLDDATAVLAELGVEQPLVRFAALENSEDVHHLVVCTLCSCYPREVLGRPPTWYKSLPYRARAVRDPRGVLEEFGVVLPAETEVRVVDSSADLRYLVIPRRPGGTEGWGEEELRNLVTRDSMVGVGMPRSP